MRAVCAHAKSGLSDRSAVSEGSRVEAVCRESWWEGRAGGGGSAKADPWQAAEGAQPSNGWLSATGIRRHAVPCAQTAYGEGLWGVVQVLRRPLSLEAGCRAGKRDHEWGPWQGLGWARL